MRLICTLVLSRLVVLTARGDEARPAPVNKDKAPNPTVARANNDLAFDLYARLLRDSSDESLFFSPYSIGSALVIAAQGARGETAEEMGKVLRLARDLHQPGSRPWKLEPIHAGLASLNRQFEAASRPPSS